MSGFFPHIAVLPSITSFRNKNKFDNNFSVILVMCFCLLTPFVCCALHLFISLTLFFFCCCWCCCVAKPFLGTQVYGSSLVKMFIIIMSFISHGKILLAHKKNCLIHVYIHTLTDITICFNENAMKWYVKTEHQWSINDVFDIFLS